MHFVLPTRYEDSRPFYDPYRLYKYNDIHKKEEFINKIIKYRFIKKAVCYKYTCL